MDTTQNLLTLFLVRIVYLNVAFFSLTIKCSATIQMCAKDSVSSHRFLGRGSIRRESSNRVFKSSWKSWYRRSVSLWISVHILAINGHKNKYPLTYMSFSPFFRMLLVGKRGLTSCHTRPVYIWSNELLHRNARRKWRSPITVSEHWLLQISRWEDCTLIRPTYSILYTHL